MEHFTQFLKDETATVTAGKSLASYLTPGMVCYLHGDLGAGKTTFVRGVLQGKGYNGRVKSPTYTLVEPYDINGVMLYHFDLYRFQDEEEWEAAGFREYFNSNSICLVEWPERAERILPPADLELTLTWHELGRCLDYRAHSLPAKDLLLQLQAGES